MRLLRVFILVFFQKKPAEAIWEYFDSAKFDASRFFNLVHTHKLWPIVYTVCRTVQWGKKYPRMMNKIIEAYSKRQKHKQNLIAQLNIISRHFQKKKIKVIPYKGISLIEHFYPNPAWRDFVDVDFAIRLEDIPLAASALFDLGYEEYKNKTDFSNFRNSRAYDIDYSFVQRQGGKIKYNVELHWQPSHNVLWCPIKFDALMDRTIILNKRLLSAPIFDKQIAFLLLLVHHGLVDTWGKLRHLIDLHFALKSFDKTELETTLLAVKKYGLVKTLHIGKELLTLLEKDNYLEQSLGNNHLYIDIMQNNLNGNWSEQKIKLKYHLSMRDGWIDKLKVVFNLGKFYIKQRAFWRE